MVRVEFTQRSEQYVPNLSDCMRFVFVYKFDVKF